MKKESKIFFEKMSGKEPEVPYESDIVIIGGGLVGMMCAYWIKQLNPVAYTVTVIEKDLSLQHTATSVFYEGLRQQYPVQEYATMANFTASFFKDINEHLNIQDLQAPDIAFNPQGSLMLSRNGDESASELIRRASSMGMGVDVMEGGELGKMFPWIKSDDVGIASLGYEKEGWFDVGLLMSALKGKAASMAVRFINGEVVGFGKETMKAYSELKGKVEHKYTLREVSIKTKSSPHPLPLKFSRCLITAGSSSSDVAKLAGIGVEDITNTPLPIIPRLKHAYLIECLDGPGLDMPMIHDHNGIFVRRHNQLGHYICTCLRPTEDIRTDEDSNNNFFEQFVRPKLINRIPSFKSLKLLEQWHGYTDHNDYDQGLFLSNHPYYLNLFIAAGGPTMELSPAVGKSVMELILKDKVHLIDPDRVSFDRVIYNEKFVINK